ncbi:MAG: S9 family peptidase, partial [Rickettsiaceae bacterium]|nr:S9 family peptidase [Rickettsiaceae bacterium]
DYSATKPWSTYIAEKKDKYLSSFDLTQNYLLMNYKVKGLAELVARNLNNETQQVLNFPENTYTAGIYSTNFKENDIRINYSSLARPDTVYSYDFNSNKLSTLKVQEIPSGFDPEEYATERVFVKTDGVEVPVSLFYKKSLFKGDGSNPLYLYGYGSYGLSIAPSFRSSAVSLVNRGFIYAIAHIRGGDDLGHDWYEDAKFLNKKRTFSDFIAVTEELINLNYTSKGNIVIVGGSAGGMLVGNVINQRPELFKAVIAHVPFVDVLNTMLDENLPLTPGEYKEWGNPKEKDYFEYMKSYSPYDNVSKQNYPSLFVSAGLSDPRVGYWEAAKWVARLRDRKLGDNVIIFKTNMSFGHSGASGRFDYLKEAAEDLVFITKIFKVK